MPRDSGERNTSPLIIFYLIVVGVVALDQSTKLIALSKLSPYESFPVVENIFHLTLVENKGVAFGLFRDHPMILGGVITLSLVLLFCWAHFSKQMTGAFRLAMGLILGGAVGNWVDRVRWGAVIDFLDFRIWPVFNFADCAISIGVGIYILSLFFEAKKKKQISS